MTQSATLTAWQALLTSPADIAYDILADMLQLPRISEFPRPGDARTWLANDWLEWGAERGFVPGAKTKHGQVVQHRQWTAVSLHVGISAGDVRSAMNCAQDGRHTLVQFLERVRQACRVLAEDGLQPDQAPADWLVSKLTGAAGQTLMERAKKVMASETEAQSAEADQLLKRLRPFYPSIRASLIDLGCTESTADRLILLNKGKASWTFMGMADQLIPIMRVMLDDHRSAGQPDEPRKAESVTEPEVIGPETVASAVATIEQPSAAALAITEMTKGSFTQIARLLANQSALVERAAHEVPEFVRVSRQRNTTFYRLVTDLIEFQVKQHAFIAKYEQSDLFEQLTKTQQELQSFKEHTGAIQHVMTRQSVYIEEADRQLNLARATINRQQAELVVLEEKVTDPQAEHVLQKLKDMRALLEGKIDVFELVKNVERIKQILDALIKAGT